MNLREELTEPKLSEFIIIDRRSLCSGRIHYKITLEVCLQDGQVLSSI